ncbi:hypothetical protein GEV43_12325 [Actinomadura sp. J1-007]|uniref:hypothetical protein n=1 Tax=Actinomadura sp. J1-007 TaxID=2661913 RepID=UPI0013225BC9|nr:hypothetical protein [Actinomadura sp. J1-007]MWK34747.1 hypothetical protein [Actinomadura sp. J1-007]
MALPVQAGPAAAASTAPRACRPALTGVSISPGTVTGGKSAKGTVRVGCAPAKAFDITLKSGASTIKAPAKVRVGQGKATASFTLRTTSVKAPFTGVLTASYGEVHKGAELTVNPVAFPAACDPRLTGLSLPTADLYTGDEVTGTVRADCAPAEDIAVGLATGDRRVSVPPVAIIRAGQTAATFQLKVRDEEFDQFQSKVAARYGADLLAQPVTVSPGLKSFELESQADDTDVFASILLWWTSPPTGTVVHFSSDSPLLKVPATMTLDPGSRGAAFTFRAEEVTSPQKVRVTATLGTRTLTAEVTLVPAG